MIVFFMTKRLAFGSKVRLNRHIEKLYELGITHVIDVRNYPSKKLRKFKTVHLNFKDDARPRPMWFYAQALRFYEKALERSNSKIYVMCRAGRRRSASMTYFLLRASGLGSNAAEATIRRARPCVQIVRAYRESSEQYLLSKKIRPPRLLRL
jgi:rhodanese-related sulfurtransferase